MAHRHGLLFSAPQLAEHLRDILGSDAGRWLREDSLQTAPPDTQKIALKALEGKEASSLGVVEGSNLYVVSGGDVVSPEAVGSSKSEADPNATTRKVLNPARAGDGAKPALEVGDLQLPISVSEEEDEEPTRARPPLPGVTPPKTRRPTNPYGNATDGGGRQGGRRPLSLPPSHSAGPETPPPPLSFESPFEDDESEADNYPPTPPPLQVTPPPTYSSAPAPSRRGSGGLPRGLPQPSGESGPPYSVPVKTQQGLGSVQIPALELQAPEIIDFGAVVTPAMPIRRQRSGPNSLLVLLVLIAAMVGGAKVAEIVTRGDLAALGMTPDPQPPPPTAATQGR